jgi:hypothetical protein
MPVAFCWGKTMHLRLLLPVLPALFALPQVADAQGVTFADLQGAVVSASVTYMQSRRSERGEFTGEVRQEWRLRLGPGDAIQYTSTITSVGRRGSRSSAPNTGTARLNRPGNASSHGGGHGLWVFMDGTLTFLRTYREDGAYKRSISFRRGAGGFTCNIRTAFARENGRGAVRLASPVSGARIEVLSSKQIASSCRVSKGG